MDIFRPVQIAWIDGPTSEQVLEVVRPFESSNDNYVTFNGKHYRSNMNYLVVDRKLSLETFKRLAVIYCKQNRYPLPNIVDNKYGPRVDYNDPKYRIRTRDEYKKVLGVAIADYASSIAFQDIPTLEIALAHLSLADPPTTQEVNSTSVLSREEAARLEDVRVSYLKAMANEPLYSQQYNFLGKQLSKEVYEVLRDSYPLMKRPTICSYCYAIHEKYQVLGLLHVCPTCWDEELKQVNAEDVELPVEHVSANQPENFALASAHMPTVDQQEAAQVEQIEDEVHEEVGVLRDEEGREVDAHGRAYPILRRDTDDGWWWLWFPEKPGAEVRQAMHKFRWQWGKYRKEWYNQSILAQVPPIVKEVYGRVVDGGECSYSSERGWRLRQRSDQKQEEAQQCADRSNQIVEEKLSTGVVILGSRIGRRQQKAKQQAERQAEKALALDAYAEELDRRADNSEAHQRYRKTPEAIYKRLNILKAQRRKIEKDFVRMLWYTAQTKEEASYFYRSTAQIQAERAERDRKIAILEQEIKVLEEKYRSTGGIEADHANIQPGDQIWICNGLREVVRINDKTITCLCQWPGGKTYPSKFDKTEFSHIVYKRNGSNMEYVETEEQREARLKRSQYAPPQEKEKRFTFKVEDVTEVQIWADNPTGLFPTPPDVGSRFIYVPEGTDAVLEPNGGAMTLIRQIESYLKAHGMESTKIHSCEVLYDLAKKLRESGYLVGEDFLEYRTRKYRCILMNPPFNYYGNSLIWVDHFMHAWELLEDGGYLGGVAPASFLRRDDRKIAELRDLVEHHGTYEELEVGAFTVSGTNIPTVIIKLSK
jgi:hypothetical protein